MTHEVPEGWTTKQVEDILLPVKGAMKIGPFGSQLKKSDILGGPFKVYGQENVFASDFSLGERFVSEEKFQQLRSCQLFPGDLVLTMMGTIGKVAVCPSNLEQGIMDSHLLRLQCDPSVVLTEYVRHLFAGSKLIYEQVARMSQGGIMAGLNSKIVRSLLFPLPPLHEQKKIAEVLSSVDEAIAATKAVIDQTKQVKKGLLQTLLTKGIGHTKFKQTELGEIPESWEVKSVEDVCSKVTVGIASSATHAYAASGIPMLRNQNILDGSLKTDDLLYVTQDFHEENKSKAIKAGDVITMRTGYPGRSAVVPEEFDNCQTFTTLVSRPKQSLILPSYLAIWINSDRGMRFVKSRQAGGAQQNLNAGVLKTIPVAVPTMHEQAEISSKVAECDDFRDRNLYELAQLQVLKSGLMSDLLTGRKRVKVLDA